MTNRQSNGSIVRQLRTLFDVGPIGNLTDGQLLERFATDRAEVAELAFSALVERHEALVWRVCLAIVRDKHLAEDAFQATFLVLVRKSRSLWVRDSLGPWLHQVAYRTASSLRASNLRRRKHEFRRAAQDAGRPIEVEPSSDLDLEAAVHAELDRLPAKYRMPVVLCDLEGRTQQEAARFLGWPIGTVKSRQSRGRGLLRDRLIQRGLRLSLVGVAVESLSRAAFATVPKTITRRIGSAAILHSARLATSFGVSEPVFALSQGVLRTMFWIKLRSFTAVALTLGLASGMAGVYVRGSQGQAPQGGQHTPQPSPTVSDQISTPESPALRSEIRVRQLATRKAKILFDIAKATRELAELAVDEYEEVTYPQDLAKIEGEIVLAKSDFDRAKDRVAWSKKMLEKGYVSKGTNVADELSLERTRFDFEQANTTRDVLMKYTKDKTSKQLRTTVEKARADEQVKQSTWEGEQSAWDLEKLKENTPERLRVPKSN